MRSLVVSPIQWSNYKDIDDIEPVNNSDSKCMEEVRDVLKRHNRLDRFGLALLHKHFDLQDDEVMLEKYFEDDRTLVLKPEKLKNITHKTVGTIYVLKEGIQPVARCPTYCYSPMGHHMEKHKGPR